MSALWFFAGMATGILAMLIVLAFGILVLAWLAKELPDLPEAHE